MGKKVLALLAAVLLLASVSLAEKAPVTREYFEHLDKDSSLQDIVKEIGQFGFEGSGIVWFVWHLDDGSRAKVLFNSMDRIEMIYIAGENGSERIYKREHQKVEPVADSAEDGQNTYIDQAVIEMDQAIGERLPASARMSWYKYELFDVTEDGCADLCTCVTWGSGMVRTDLIVYDPVSKELYVLDGYNYNYLIDRIEEDRIVIVMEGPYGYNDPLTKTYGTVRVEDGKLVFIPDPEEP